jgi:predicted alpha-1,6-mannanase (GH76 family)
VVKQSIRGFAAAILASASLANAVPTEQADLAIAAYNKTFWNATQKHFYKLDNKSGVLDFWMSAHAWETVMDAYVRTGKKEFLDQIGQVYDGFNARHTADWTRNDYNDDIMWWVLASARAYAITGEKRYLTQAKTHFDWVWTNERDSELGGGIWWKNSEHATKNSCVVAPAIISAILLAKGLADDGYRVKAESLYAWQKRTLVEPTGKVYDNIRKDGTLAKGSTTYNQGTWIGSALLLGHLADAEKAADWTRANLVSTQGIFKQEGPGQGDFGTFKLICIRYVVELGRLKGSEKYAEWMEANAVEVWENRRVADNIMGFDWTKAAPATGIESQSAAGGVALLNLLAKPSVSIKPLRAVKDRNGAELRVLPVGAAQWLFGDGAARADGRALLR